MTKLQKPMKIWQWAGIAIGAALLSAWLILYSASLDVGGDMQGTSISSRTPSHEAKVIINFGDGEKRAFQGSIIEGMSAYHALLASGKAGNLEVEIVSSTEGSFVKKIDSVLNSDTEEWNYYLNDKFQDRYSIDREAISPGDTIEFKYE